MSETKKEVKEVKEKEPKYSKEEINDGKFMSVLAYLGILALIPYFAEKKNKYVRYHAIQGMNFMVVCVGYSILTSILSAIIKVNRCFTYWGYESCVKATPGWLSVILWLVGIPLTVFCIMGIVYACQGKTKELPLVGKVKIFKK